MQSEAELLAGQPLITDQRQYPAPATFEEKLAALVAKFKERCEHIRNTKRWERRFLPDSIPARLYRVLEEIGPATVREVALHAGLNWTRNVSAIVCTLRRDGKVASYDKVPRRYETHPGHPKTAMVLRYVAIPIARRESAELQRLAERFLVAVERLKMRRGGKL
jgi:hypothetical protein